MSALLLLIPVALFLGLVGLAAFIWSLKSGQFDDLDGAAARLRIDDDAPPEEIERLERERTAREKQRAAFKQPHPGTQTNRDE